MRKLSALGMMVLLFLVCGSARADNGSQTSAVYYYARLCPAGPQVSAILAEQGVTDTVQRQGCVIARLTLEQMTGVYVDVERLREEGGPEVFFERVSPPALEQGLQPVVISDLHASAERAGDELQARQVVAIIVEASIYDAIQPALSTYVADVTSRHPTVRLLLLPYWASSPESLRGTLQDLYASQGIHGAILVGSLPYAMWEFPWGSPEVCSLPLFYEDLDGTFVDQDSDGYYDSRDWGPNEGIEIWVSWIRSPTQQEAVAALQTFFEKTHRYYSGAEPMPEHGLVVNAQSYWWMDDWVRQPLEELYGPNVDQLGGCETCYVPAGTYVQQYTSHDYAVQGLLLHSGNFGHAFDLGTWLWGHELANLTHGPWFSVVWGCHTMDLTIYEDGCGPIDGVTRPCEWIFATHYIMGTHNGRAALGVTRSIGTPEMGWFLERLPRAPYLGNAAWQLLNLVEARDYVYWQEPNQPHQFVWGIALVGDPFLAFNTSRIGTLDLVIGHASDDAEEGLASGEVSLYGVDLELGADGDTSQAVGLRFRNVAVPRGATITQAYLEFAAGETHTGATELTFQAQASDDAPAFHGSGGDISSRPLTAASARWYAVPPWAAIGETYRSPNLATIVQEVIDRAGWQPGNALALLATGSGQRTAVSYDGDPTMAPVLHIAYGGERTCHNLSSGVFPDDSGSITVEPAPNCGPGQYMEGTQVQLTASPAEDFTFDSWRDSETGTLISFDNPATMIMDMDRTVSARFRSTPDGYEPDGFWGQANDIRTGIPQVHSLVPPGDQDWVKFHIGSESAAVLSAHSEYNPIRLLLHNTDLNLMETDYGSCNDRCDSYIDRLCDTDSLPPGTYYVGMDDPGDVGQTRQIPEYEVVLTTTPCGAAGLLAGTVTGLGYCDEQPAPVAGAEVTIQSTQGPTWMLTTGDAGDYGLWLDESYSPLTITVAHPEHATQMVSGVLITPGVTTTLDLYLRLQQPCVSVTPTQVTAIVTLGQTATQTLALANRGGGAAGFGLGPRVLLADGDSDEFHTYDARPYYETALRHLGVDYDLEGPVAAEMAAYPAVIWFSGDATSWHLLRPLQPPSPAVSPDEVRLAAYLDLGGSLFLSSQDYCYEQGLTGFMRSYLGVARATDDAAHTTISGVPGDPVGGGFGTLALSYPGRNYSDSLTPDATASAAFEGDQGGYAAIDKESGYRTVFFGFPWEALQAQDPASGEAVLGTILEWFGLEEAVPWLSVEPVTGTLPADSDLAVGLSFDAGVPLVMAGGEYTTTLVLYSNDPARPRTRIPVTMTVVSFGVAVEPAADARSGDPGSPVTYTLWLTNTGSVQDSFDLTVSGNAWLTGAPATAGPLLAGVGAAVEVVVAVPAGIAVGATDTATVAITSQGDHAQSASVVLTTMANAAYGVRVTPATAMQSGSPGAAVTFTLAVSNSGNLLDVYDVTISGNSWPSSAPGSVGPLAAGGGASLPVTVRIPVAAAPGARDTATVRLVSQGDNTRRATAQLTTTVQHNDLYLPLVVRKAP